ncbi:hypothetical protein Droror1_Dr00012119, partial [Drosera rotundifolia]
MITKITQNKHKKEDPYCCWASPSSPGDWIIVQLVSGYRRKTPDGSYGQICVSAQGGFGNSLERLPWLGFNSSWQGRSHRRTGTTTTSSGKEQKRRRTACGGENASKATTRGEKLRGAMAGPRLGCDGLPGLSLPGSGFQQAESSHSHHPRHPDITRIPAETPTSSAKLQRKPRHHPTRIPLQSLSAETSTSSTNPSGAGVPTLPSSRRSSPTTAAAAKMLPTKTTQRGLNKPKCIKCGNVARSRCPYQSCKSCCSKVQNPCHIHVLKPNATLADRFASNATPELQTDKAPSPGPPQKVGSLRQLSTNFAQFNNVNTPVRPRKPLTRK